MIDIRPPTALQSRSFSPLTFRQRARTLFEGGIRSPNQRQRRAEPDAGSGHRSAIQSPLSGISSINLRFKTSAPTPCDPQIPIDRASGATALS